MKVLAIAAGYYGGLRSAGDKFTLSSKDDFSKTWMQRMAVEKPVGKGKGGAKTPAAPPADEEIVGD